MCFFCIQQNGILLLVKIILWKVFQMYTNYVTLVFAPNIHLGHFSTSTTFATFVEIVCCKCLFLCWRWFSSKRHHELLDVFLSMHRQTQQKNVCKCENGDAMEKRFREHLFKEHGTVKKTIFFLRNMSENG